MSISAKQNQEFASVILPNYPLDEAVEWIRSNMEPDDVFTEDKLEAWAERNGYKREE